MKNIIVFLTLITTLIISCKNETGPLPIDFIIHDINGNNILDTNGMGYIELNKVEGSPYSVDYMVVDAGEGIAIKETFIEIVGWDNFSALLYFNDGKVDTLQTMNIGTKIEYNGNVYNADSLGIIIVIHKP